MLLDAISPRSAKRGAFSEELTIALEIRVRDSANSCYLELRYHTTPQCNQMCFTMRDHEVPGFA